MRLIARIVCRQYREILATFTFTRTGCMDWPGGPTMRRKGTR
jgi:hypothetical protein